LTPDRRVSNIHRWWPALAWTGLVFAASSIPGSTLEDTGLEIPDKLIHGIEYSVLGFLVFGAARAEGHAAAGRAFFVAVAWAMATAALDENYQRLTPMRDPSFGDWLADAIGAAVGAAIAWRSRFEGRWARRRQR
jgi:VanZ family protein